MDKEDRMNKVFSDNKLNYGRMISYSKSSYLSANPDNLVMFNANIYSDEGRVWWGDIDVTKDKDTLTKISKELGETLYVLSEYDSYKIENENDEGILNYKSFSIWNTSSGLSKFGKYYDEKTLKRLN